MAEPALLPQFIREALADERSQAAAEPVLNASDAVRFRDAVLSPEAAQSRLSPEAAQSRLSPGAAQSRLVPGAAQSRLVPGAVLSPEAARSLETVLSLEAALLRNAPAAPSAPSVGLLERLEQSLSDPPHRYAPFYARAAELFDVPESALIAQLARLKDPNVWTFAGLPGISNVRVEAGPAVADAEALLVRFNPGVRFPLHRHVGLERVLVLEGSYEDSNGVQHRAGELREWPSDTEHSFRVGHEPCIFASVVFGRRFSSWPLRALASVLGR